MHIELRIAAKHSPELVGMEYDPEFDGISSILADVTKVAEPVSSFRVLGFGDADWPVDAGIDLAIFIQQLPRVLSKLAMCETTWLYFAEQGVERFVECVPVGSGDTYKLSCTSTSGWKPDPAIEHVRRSEFAIMLRAALDEFLRAFELISPELAQHLSVRDWLKQEPVA